MIEGISSLIITQFINSKLRKKEDKTLLQKEDRIKEVPTSDLGTSFSLEKLNIEDLTPKEASHIEYLVRKLLKEDKTIENSKKELSKRKKNISLEIEKQMNRYVTDSEKKLIGILINKLI